MKCKHCGDEFPDFDVAHVCTNGPYAPNIEGDFSRWWMSNCESIDHRNIMEVAEKAWNDSSELYSSKIEQLEKRIARLTWILTEQD